MMRRRLVLVVRLVLARSLAVMWSRCL